MHYVDLLVGAALGLCVALVTDAVSRGCARREASSKLDVLLELLAFEVREGVHRCQSLIDMSNDGKYSCSRIYTAAWDAARAALAEHAHAGRLSYEVLTVLHRLYYRFDLINFNMEAGRLDKGVGFARQYIEDVRTNETKFEKLMAARRANAQRARTSHIAN